VTAPFALLSSIFGGGEELSTVSFAAGSATIAGEGEKRIDTLAKALAGRPGLKLDIGGRADPQADRDALRREAVDTALRREKLKTLAAKGEAPASVSEVTIDAEERARWVTAVWRATPHPKDAPKKEPPLAEMEAALVENAVVDDATLRDLASRRGQAVKDALAAKGIAGERLFLVAPRIGAETGGVKPTGEVKGAPSRVDLALR
jgi:hypothetical protein